MNFTTIGSFFDEAENEFEPQEMKEPVEFIGNFAHSKSRKCENLITEAATILEEYGWRNEFAMYYHKDKTQEGFISAWITSQVVTSTGHGRISRKESHI